MELLKFPFFFHYHFLLKKSFLFLETKYDGDSGDWYVALGWKDKRVIVKMDSVLATITEIKEI